LVFFRCPLSLPTFAAQFRSLLAFADRRSLVLWGRITRAMVLISAFYFQIPLDLYIKKWSLFITKYIKLIDIALGERLHKDIYEALRAGKNWEKTLFLIMCA